jgi:hypothetical protein
MNTTARLAPYFVAVNLLCALLNAQPRPGMALTVGFTESEKPVVSASFVQRITPGLSTAAGIAFFHPGYQVVPPWDPEEQFVSVTQIFAAFQVGEMLFVAPRLSHNWYGPYRSFRWGVSGGFSFQLNRSVSIGLVASHDRLRFDDQVDPYGPSPFTSISLLGRFWFLR